MVVSIVMLIEVVEVDPSIVFSNLQDTKNLYVLVASQPTRNVRAFLHNIAQQEISARGIHVSKDTAIYIRSR